MADLLTVDLPDAEATHAAGLALGRAAAGLPGGILHLVGGLGTGKTSLARGFLTALGVTGPVRSPTYTLMEPYDTEPPVLHMDFYRLDGAEDVVGLGLDDWPPDGCWWLVEWPDRGGAGAGVPDLVIELDGHGAGRRLQYRSRSTTGLKLLDMLGS